MTSHLPNFARRADVIQPAIIQRPESDLAERVRDRFGFERATTDWHDIIEARPDVVLVSSPAGFHYEQTKAAPQAGAHVLREKPFTLRAAEAWDLVREAHRTGKNLVLSWQVELLSSPCTTPRFLSATRMDV